METNITSNNQSGGVTGHTVHVAGAVQSTVAAGPPAAKSRDWKKIIAAATAGIALVVAAVKGLRELGLITF